MSFSKKTLGTFRVSLFVLFCFLTPAVIANELDRSDRISIGGLDFVRVEIRANTFTTSTQGAVSVAFDEAHNLIAVWESRRQDKGNYGVYAQCFSPVGKRIGSEMQVNTTRRSAQWKPSLAGCGSTAWIGWESFGQDGDGFGCFLRRFDSDLSAGSDEIDVNAITRGDQTGLVLAPSRDGGVIAAWIGPEEDSLRRKAWCLSFDADGNRRGAPIQIDAATDREENLVSIASRGPRGFVAAWAAVGEDNRPAGIYARLFGPDGSATTPAFGINECNDAGSIEPALATGPDGSFAVAWMEIAPGENNYAVNARAFCADGAPRTAPFRVSEAGAAGQSGASVAVADDGRLCVAWNRASKSSEGKEIMARFYGADAAPLGSAFSPLGSAFSPLGSAFSLNQIAQRNQSLHAPSGQQKIAFGRDGQLAVAWSGASDLGDRKAANVTLLLPVPEGPAGDLDGSGLVDSGDLGIFYDILTHVDRDPRRYAAADIDGNGSVDRADLEAFIEGNKNLPPAIMSEGEERLTALEAAIKDATLILEKRAEARKLAMEKERAESPALNAAVDVAVPHEPPVRRGTGDTVLPYNGDPDPFFSRSDPGFVAVLNTGWAPPDPHMAAGPEHLVAMTNGAIAFFDKDGNNLFQDEIEDSYGFWGSVGATWFVFDPEVIYDPHSGRFMAMACERSSTNTSEFLLAVSDDSNPMGTWYKYRLNVTSLAGNDIDSPNIAVDEDVVYLTADFFSGGQKYLVYAIEKADLLVGGTVLNTNHLLITGSQSYGIPVMYDSAAAFYMIEHYEGSSNTRVRLHALTDPLGAMNHQTYQLTVPSYTPPTDPPQMGTSTRPETFDARFWSCVYRNGSLWAAHHQGNARVLSRWYEIDMGNWPTSGTPTLIQSGDVDPGSGIHTFFNSISVDAFGNALMCFARSSSGEYISIGRAFRNAGDPLGTMQPSEIIKTSAGPYYTSRWGDYSAVVVDPVDNATFWYHHEYNPGSSWNTWIASKKVASESLAADTATFSASAGGSVNFALDVGSAYGGRNYLLVGSLSGTSPGTVLPGGLVTIPLNRDWYTDLIIQNLSWPSFKRFWGTLDTTGTATAQLNLGPQSSGYVGTIMSYAFATANPWDFASNAVNVEIVP